MINNNNNPKDDREYILYLSKLAKEKGDCRLCKNYSFDRDIEVEFFNCSKGYFHCIDYAGERENEGEIKWYGCGGKDFTFNPNSRLAKHFRESIEKESRKRLEQKTE